MNGHLEYQKLDLITRGCIDDTAQYLLRLWIQSEGRIEDPNLFEGVAPHFVRLSGNVPDDDSPEILFVGRKSLLGQSRQAARKNAGDRRRLFDPVFRSAIRENFKRAITEPTLQIVQDEFAADDGPNLMTYERITLCWTAGDMPYLITYSKLVHRACLVSPSNPEHPTGCSLRQPNPALWN
ncbi:hypothetical protein [Roseibium alexandrii]|uniref:hypothetical protein n=1 Tax=Roseibium alexandrii TaxID=388408 RepID=UPI0037505E83